jgi:predicted component of type VI protein secretion system
MHHDLELGDGEFVIGRNASCQLSLDDALVSRRHAIFRVGCGEVSVEDLGSRNGVLVNGKKIAGRVPVAPGDKVLIGSQELTLLQVSDDDGSPPASAPATKRLTTLDLAPADLASPDAGDDDSDIATMTAKPADPPADDVSFVRRMDGFRVLGSIAEKALAMGRAEEAERVLAASLAEVAETGRLGKKIPPPLAEQATRFAAKLATATAKGSWVDYVVDVYMTLQRPAPAVVVDELYAAFRKVAGVDVGRVKAYVEMLRERLPTFGPADRFLVQRIEGLERLATLRS